VAALKGIDGGKTVYAAHRAGLIRAQDRITEAVENRDLAIRQAVAVGMRVADVAEAVGLTRGRIYQILGAE
jgi:hypothetical protein